jgi:hypothetical protein
MEQMNLELELRKTVLEVLPSTAKKIIVDTMKDFFRVVMDNVQMECPFVEIIVTLYFLTILVQDLWLV